MKKEISSDENGKEAVRETPLRCVNATHRVTPFSSVFKVLTQFSGNLQWDTSERNKLTVTKEISSVEKEKEAFIETSS